VLYMPDGSHVVMSSLRLLSLARLLTSGKGIFLVRQAHVMISPILRFLVVFGIS
jgi:hypothetical protein